MLGLSFPVCMRLLCAAQYGLILHNVLGNGLKSAKNLGFFALFEHLFLFAIDHRSFFYLHRPLRFFCSFADAAAENRSIEY